MIDPVGFLKDQLETAGKQACQKAIIAPVAGFALGFVLPFGPLLGLLIGLVIGLAIMVQEIKAAHDRAEQMKQKLQSDMKKVVIYPIIGLIIGLIIFGPLGALAGLGIGGYLASNYVKTLVEEAQKLDPKKK